MRNTRKLSLRREELGELSHDLLGQVAAAYKVITVQADCGLTTIATTCHHTTCQIVNIVMSRDGC